MSRYRVSVQGQTFSVILKERRGATISFSVNGEEHTVEISPQVGGISDTMRAGTADTIRAPRSSATFSPEIRSPIPGIISDLLVAKGQSVSEGQTVAVIEAMKMENPVRAPSAGVVADVHVQKGQEVPSGQLLVTISAP